MQIKACAQKAGTLSHPGLKTSHSWWQRNKKNPKAWVHLLPCWSEHMKRWISTMLSHLSVAPRHCLKRKGCCCCPTHVHPCYSCRAELMQSHSHTTLMLPPHVLQLPLSQRPLIHLLMLGEPFQPPSQAGEANLLSTFGYCPQNPP